MITTPLRDQLLFLVIEEEEPLQLRSRRPPTREQPEHYQQFNRDHARLRAPGERAFAQLKIWRLLRRARCSTRRIGTIVQAVHTLLTCDYRG